MDHYTNSAHGTAAPQMEPVNVLQPHREVPLAMGATHLKVALQVFYLFFCHFKGIIGN